MAAYRVFDPFRVFFNDLGEPLAGGEIRFFAAGTTTPKDVYGDIDLSVNNGSTVELDSAGRANVDIWGDGDYFAELYDADGVKVDDADDIELPGGSGTSIPTLVTGEFLTNDGANLQWDAIRQVPDPAGQSGKILGTDGSNLLWEDPPPDPEPPIAPDIEVTTAKFRAADGATSFLMQVGNDTAGASGTKSTSVAVTFPTTFAATPKVFVETTSGFVTQGGNVMPTTSVTNKSTTGFTVTFCTETGESNSNGNIVTPVAFDWVAIGTIATPA